MGSAVNQAPGGCECSDEPCVGRICVTLSGPCHADDNKGVTVIAYRAGTESAAGSAATDADGAACVGGLEPGDYDVVARKEGYQCSTVTWPTATIPPRCGTVTLPSKPIYCLPNAGWQFTIRGCFNSPLPGAVVKIVGPLGSTSQGETDGDGKTTVWAAETGVHAVTVTHPSGRFKPWNTTINQATLCQSGSVPARTLEVADGYECCAIQQLVNPPSPYPISTTLKVTDPSGTSTAIRSSACSYTLCAMRAMGDVAAKAPSEFGVVYACSDSPGLSNIGPAPGIGAGATRVAYTIGLALSPVARQTIPEFTALAPGGRFGVSYAMGYPDDKRCSLSGNQQFKRRWRVARECGEPLGSGGGSQAEDIIYTSSGYTVNSLYPLNVTFHFAPGEGFGPMVRGVSSHVPGSPYTTSVVVSE